MSNTLSPWPCRVLLVDENDDFLDGLTNWFDGSREIDVAGRAHSCAETFQRISRLEPDLVLIDTALPDGNGFDVVQAIKAKPDPPFVVMMSFHESELFQSAAASGGADGCITKADVPQMLVSHVTTLFKRQASNPTDQVGGRPDG